MSYPNPQSDQLLSVKEVATICKVEERTITKWIRENKIPAKKGTKHWFIREDHVFHFVNNNGKMPPDYLPIDNRRHKNDLFSDNVSHDFNIDTVRSIQPFASMEGGKSGHKERHATKFPHEFMPRVNNILAKFPQYQGIFHNLIRDAVWCRILDLEKIMELHGVDLDPGWAAYNISTEVLQRTLAAESQIATIEAAIKKLRDNKNIKEIKKYKAKMKEEIRDMEEPYKSRAYEILKIRPPKDDKGEDMRA